MNIFASCCWFTKTWQMMCTVAVITCCTISPIDCLSVHNAYTFCTCSVCSRTAGLSVLVITIKRLVKCLCSCSMNYHIQIFYTLEWEHLVGVSSYAMQRDSTTMNNTRLTVFFHGNSVSWHQKGKQLWILMKQEMMGWQWHQLDYMQIICTLLQIDDHTGICIT